MNALAIKVDDNPQYGLVVTSRNVAKGLNKRHSDVLESIEKISENGNLRSLIIPTFYRAHNQKRQYKEYLLTKDGFTLYMFNIQGHNDFKMAYIKRFNEMEKALANPQPVPKQQSLEPAYEKPTRKTFHNNAVMTTQDLAYLLKRPRGSVFWHVQQAGTSGVLLEGEHLRDFKNENGIHSTVSNIMIYHSWVVEAVLKAYGCYEEHKEFLDEYFALEGDPSMTRDDMRAAVQQAHLLLTIAREIQNPRVKEQNLMAVTALLINIGLWTEKRAGFNGVTANWDINTAEGWNKLGVLHDAQRQWKY